MHPGRVPEIVHFQKGRRTKPGSGTPPGCYRFAPRTGGLRCASTSGYPLASLRDAWRASEHVSRMIAPLLQLTSVTKSFGAVRALKGVSFDLKAGEVHALLGENGAGKSTLIKIITGAHQPDGGAIDIAGQRAERLSPATAHKLGIACIYQQPALFPDLTVAENVALRLQPPGTFERIHWTARRRQAQELLHRIGAEIPPDAEVRSLSMPEQQLVEIASALGTGARIVIMDEP